MKMIIILNFFIFMILFFMTVILNFISKKTFYDREKNSPFECGFDPKNLSRLPFSLQFFLIAIIFVIFDVELTLLLPSVKIMKISNLTYMSFTFNFFIMILITGLLHEQNEGSLNWVM